MINLKCVTVDFVCSTNYLLGLGMPLNSLVVIAKFLVT